MSASAPINGQVRERPEASSASTIPIPSTRWRPYEAGVAEEGGHAEVVLVRVRDREVRREEEQLVRDRLLEARPRRAPRAGSPMPPSARGAQAGSGERATIVHQQRERQREEHEQVGA